MVALFTFCLALLAALSAPIVVVIGILLDNRAAREMMRDGR